MRRISLIALAWCLGAVPALAMQQPAPGREDGHVRYTAYESGNVINLPTAPFHEITIQFAPNETIFRVSSIMAAYPGTPMPKGAKSIVVTGFVSNILIITPMVPLPPQPLTVLTTLPDGKIRPYLFLISAKAGPPPIYKMVITYPNAAYKKRLAKEKAEAKKQITREANADLNETMDQLVYSQCNTPGGMPNYMYIGQGYKPMSPRVCDNGHDTVFTFAPGQRLPSIFKPLPDQQPASVNFTAVGHSMVLSGVRKHWILIDGTRRLDIYNKSPTPYELPSPTNTISPGVNLVTEASNGD